MEGAVLMINGRALEFLDRLKNDERSLGVDEVRYLCFLATTLKEVGFF
jgi:hypothetical protein